MPVPDYQSLMLPVLRLARDGNVHAYREAVEALAQEFNLTPAERQELLPSGSQRKFDNRVGWARTYLVKAGLLQCPARGKFTITARGTEVLRSNPTFINVAYLRRYPEFMEFQSPTREPETSLPVPADEGQTPEETLEVSYLRLRQTLAGQLLEKVKSCSPEFFEDLVVDLLVAMGYGGSRKDAKSVGRSGDGGIDGIIKEDKLGLDAVYVQAKRWDGTVGRPTVQAFAGSLEGARARKGVLITTSQFSTDAVDYAQRIEKRIVLIDGNQLAQLMMDYGIGVATVASYAVMRMDSDYFQED